jgi:hypothetical protein
MCKCADVQICKIQFVSVIGIGGFICKGRG